MQGEIHPCFTSSCSEYARVHLPVAPKCNIQCNYCLRKFDCANECRPGVTSKIMEPDEAVSYYERIRNSMPTLTTVGVAGPGDALANYLKVEETICKIREFDRKVNFCISTNGLMLPVCADKLMEIGVRYITVTVNAINPVVAEKIYKWVEFNGIIYRGKEAAEVLTENQIRGIEIAKYLGFKVKVNTVAILGINIEEIPLIAKKSRELGCEVMNIIPLMPIPGTDLENVPILGNSILQDLRKTCGQNIRQMFHCRHCRADAVGTLK